MADRFRCVLRISIVLVLAALSRIPQTEANLETATGSAREAFSITPSFEPPSDEINSSGQTSPPGRENMISTIETSTLKDVVSTAQTSTLTDDVTTAAQDITSVPLPPKQQVSSILVKGFTQEQFNAKESDFKQSVADSVNLHCTSTGECAQQVNAAHRRRLLAAIEWVDVTANDVVITDKKTTADSLQIDFFVQTAVSTHTAANTPSVVPRSATDGAVQKRIDDVAKSLGVPTKQIAVQEPSPSTKKARLEESEITIIVVCCAMCGVVLILVVTLMSIRIHRGRSKSDSTDSHKHTEDVCTHI